MDKIPLEDRLVDLVKKGYVVDLFSGHTLEGKVFWYAIVEEPGKEKDAEGVGDTIWEAVQAALKELGGYSG